jgi:hypothetical protein
LNLSFEPWKQPTSSSFAHFSSCKYRAQDERASPRRHTPPTSQPLHLSPLQIPTSVAANPSLCSFPRAAKLFAHLVPLFSLNKNHIHLVRAPPPEALLSPYERGNSCASSSASSWCKDLL